MSPSYYSLNKIQCIHFFPVSESSRTNNNRPSNSFESQQQDLDFLIGRLESVTNKLQKVLKLADKEGQGRIIIYFKNPPFAIYLAPRPNNQTLHISYYYGLKMLVENVILKFLLLVEVRYFNLVMKNIFSFQFTS